MFKPTDFPLLVFAVDRTSVGSVFLCHYKRFSFHAFQKFAELSEGTGLAQLFFLKYSRRFSCIVITYCVLASIKLFVSALIKVLALPPLNSSLNFNCFLASKL